MNNQNASIDFGIIHFFANSRHLNNFLTHLIINIGKQLCKEKNLNDLNLNVLAALKKKFLKKTFFGKMLAFIWF